MRFQPGKVFAALCRGLVAGAAGTVLMTLAQRLDMKLEGREEASSAPAEAVEKTLGLEPRSPEAKERLTRLSHWAYGTSWGAARGVLGVLGLGVAPATVAHLALVWGSALVILPALDLAEPPTEGDGEQLAKDFAFHAVYAVGTSLAYELLDRGD